MPEARVHGAVDEPLGQRLGGDHVQAPGAHGHPRDQGGDRAVGGHDHVARPHGAGGGDDRARMHRGLHLGPLVDARAGPFGGPGQRPDPARGLQRAVVVGEAGAVEAALQRGRQRVALDQLAGEAVGAQRGNLAAHVVGLLLRGRHAQQAGATDRVAGAELGGQLVDLLLGRERARVGVTRVLGPVALAGVVVEGGHPGEQEATVAPARPAGDGVALQHHGLHATPSKPARAREPAHARADHARLDLDVARERRSGLVGLVQPESGGHGANAPPSTRSACSAKRPAATASRSSRISRSMKVRLCSVTRRFAVSSPARIR